MFPYIWIWALSLTVVLAAELFGRFENVPQDALEAASFNLASHIVNGLNFQSRIDVWLVEILEHRVPKRQLLPVDRDYKFHMQGLNDGQYELLVSAYDFIVPSARYRIIVKGDQVEAFEDPLTSPSYNVTSRRIVTPNDPLNVEISGLKTYYESNKGKLGEMIMNSPFGFIFKSKLYLALFFGMLLIMAFPYVIFFVSPELSEQFKEAQKEAHEKPKEKALKSAVGDEATAEEKAVLSEKPSAAKSAKLKKRK